MDRARLRRSSRQCQATPPKRSARHLALHWLSRGAFRRHWGCGAAFVGPDTPISGDYVSGFHFFRGRCVRYGSPRGVYYVVARTSYIQYTRAAVREQTHSIAALARAKGRIPRVRPIQRTGTRLALPASDVNPGSARITSSYAAYGPPSRLPGSQACSVVFHVGCSITEAIVSGGPGIRDGSRTSRTHRCPSARCSIGAEETSRPRPIPFLP